MKELIKEVEKYFTYWDRSVKVEMFEYEKKVQITECVVLMLKVPSINR